MEMRKNQSQKSPSSKEVWPSEHRLAVFTGARSMRATHDPFNAMEIHWKLISSSIDQTCDWGLRGQAVADLLVREKVVSAVFVVETTSLYTLVVETGDSRWEAFGFGWIEFR